MPLHTCQPQLEQHPPFLQDLGFVSAVAISRAVLCATFAALLLILVIVKIVFPSQTCLTRTSVTDLRNQIRGASRVTDPQKNHNHICTYTYIHKFRYIYIHPCMHVYIYTSMYIDVFGQAMDAWAALDKGSACRNAAVGACEKASRWHHALCLAEASVVERPGFRFGVGWLHL